MEIPQFEGKEIITELRRQIKVEASKRPFMGVFTTDPEHKGGIEFVPVRIDSLATHLDDRGEVLDITATFAMEDGDKTYYIGASYNTRDNTISANGRNIRRLNIYYTP